MSGIQRFFGGPGKDKAKGATNRAKKPSPRKRPPPHVEGKRGASLMQFEGSDDDDEDPLPKSVRKAAEKTAIKRKKAVILSDSEEDEPAPSKKSATPSPKKATPKKKGGKRARFDEDESPVKQPSKKARAVRAEESEDEDEVVLVSGTDSEDEFRETKKPQKKKGGLLPGQTKLNFERKAKPAEPARKEQSSSKQVSAASFFGEPQPAKAADKKTSTTKSVATTKTVATPTPAPAPTPKQKPEKAKETVTTQPAATKPSSTNEASPGSKENAVIGSDKGKYVKMGDELYEVVETIDPARKKKLPLASPVKQTPPPPQPKKPEYDEYSPWVDRYRPMNPSHLVGMNGEKSPWNKLIPWLRDWAYQNLGANSKVKKPRPPPWLAGQDGSIYKAVLLSGPPGVGKTTCAKMACQQLGFETVEMNASDVRNKKHLEAHVLQLTSSHQMEEYLRPEREQEDGAQKVRHVLIMDEVDGMSGNEDRAGISELMDIIKSTMIPIICICNDRSHPKMRSLVNYCFDVRFPRPRVEQVRSRVMTIAVQEKMRISKEELDELIELSNHDVRQCIYNLQMRKAQPDITIAQKDVTINPFEAARKLLSKSTDLKEKQEMFFVDYGIMPLFVFENYLQLTNKERTPCEHMGSIRRAAELISMGDQVDKMIRSTGAWRLLNDESMLSAALPSMAMDGYLKTQISFPGWLGKNSTAGKRQRLARQVAQHAHLRICADMESLVTDYVPALRNKLVRPLLADDTKTGVQEVVATYVEYDLVRDDSDAIAELACWPGMKDHGAAIPSKVKSAVTRALTKEHRTLPYAIDDISKGKKRAAGSVEVEMDEEGNVIEKGGGDEDEGDEEDEEAAPAIPAVAGGGGSGWRGGSRRGGATGGGRGGGAVRGGRGAKK